MALHVACRLALIAFATVAARGVLEGTDFDHTITTAMRIGAGVFVVGLLIGDLSRRLIEEIVGADVRRILSQTPPDNHNQDAPPDASLA